ncbi:MAG: P-II family nitrogen regulator [Erysipelotrichaceae bacterium]|jgi:nitrogen regulatory protein PII|nr:P-II family nitrogen regulator [Erysipelotrichaceae bacterium]
MNEPHEAIISIVNHGFSDLVMEAAKSAGATGGTVISGHGTGNKDIEQFFGVTVTPEKEIVIIVVPKRIRDLVLSAVNAGAGMNTKGMGIAFSCPIADVVGLGEANKAQKEISEVVESGK